MFDIEWKDLLVWGFAVAYIAFVIGFLVYVITDMIRMLRPEKCPACESRKTKMHHTTDYEGEHAATFLVCGNCQKVHARRAGQKIWKPSSYSAEKFKNRSRWW